MASEAWKRVKEIMEGAFAIPVESREAWLREKCGDDLALLNEVKSLVQHAEVAPAAFDKRERRIDADTNELAAQFVDSIPEQIGAYRILREIGIGGMGTVYEAEQDTPRRRVAIKTMSRQFPNAEVFRRFRLEAELLGRLKHPGIAQIYDAATYRSQANEIPYFVMELVDGKPLMDFVRDRALDTEARLSLMVEICEAVHHAHQRGIVHRDLKPDNILVQPNGQPKILDFGVARAIGSDFEVSTIRTEMGQLVGTIPYMSPEQVEGGRRSIDARSDVYSLGVLLYQMLSQRLPHDLLHRSVAEAARIIRDEEPERLGSVAAEFRGDLEVIVGMALEKSADRRYPSAQALADDLARFCGHAPISARPPSAMYQFSKFARRNKGLVFGLAATFLVAIVGALVAVSFALKARKNELVSLDSATRAHAAASRAEISAAFETIERAPTIAAEHLSKVPAELRKWEWRYLAARLEPSLKYDSGSDRHRTERGLSAVAFSEENNLLFADIFQREVRVIDASEGTVLACFQHDSPATEIRLSDKGSLLAVVLGAVDKLVLWDVAEQKSLAVLVAYDGVSRPRFSGDGERIVFNHADRSAAVVRCDGGELISEIMATDSEACCPQIHELSFDGSKVFQTRGYGLRSGSSRFRLSTTDLHSGVTVWLRLGEETLALNRESSHALVLSGDDLQVRDLGTQAVVATHRGHHFKSHWASFSADDKFVASSALDETRIWEASTGLVRRVLKTGGHEPIFDADSKRIAATTPQGCAMWEIEDDASSVLRGHERWVYSVAVSPDSSLIASGDFDGRLIVWDALTKERVRTLNMPCGVRGLFFTRNGRHLIATLATHPNPRESRSRTISVDLATWTWEEIEESPPTPDGGFPSSVLWTRANGGAKTGHRVENWAISYDRTHFVVGLVGSLHRVAFPELAEWMTRNSKRFVLDKSKHRDGGLPFSFPERSLPAVAMSPDGRRIISAHRSDKHGERGRLRLWDAATARELLSAEAHRGEIYSVQFSPDGERIVTGGNDNTVGLFDAQSLERVAQLHGHNGYVRSVTFSPDGNLIVSASGDGTVRVWDSVHRHRRAVEARRVRDMQLAIEPRVAELLADLGSLEATADHIFANQNFSPEERRSALRVLMSETPR